METVIRALEPCLLDDYLYFFDNVAFADHPEWSWCYCTYFHLGKQDEEQIEAEFGGKFTRDVLRNISIELVKKRKLCGYLAYADGQAVGWCNASDKKNYKKLCENHDIWNEGEDIPVLSITCFIVAPEFRRRGIAAALLDRVLKDSAKQGYHAVEAYPPQANSIAICTSMAMPPCTPKVAFCSIRSSVATAFIGRRYRAPSCRKIASTLSPLGMTCVNLLCYTP